MLTSSNNAAQSMRTSSNANKRSSLLHILFGRKSSRKRPLVSTQPSKRRIISGGDQVKLSSIRLQSLAQPYSSKFHETTEIQEETNRETELPSQGLRYDFKQVKPLLATKLSSKDQSLSNSPINEPKLLVQSAHDIGGLPKARPNNITMRRISFNADQHKYHPQTPTYHSPKSLSTIELYAKKYRPTSSLQNNTGLLWYNVNEQTVCFL